MIASSNTLNDLVAVLKDGIMLCEDFIESNPDSGLKQNLLEMVALREEAIARLAPIIESENRIVRPTGTFSGEVHKGLATVRAMLQDEETAYGAEFIASNERAIDELQVALRCDIDADSKSFLSDLITRMRKNSKAFQAIIGAEQ